MLPVQFGCAVEPRLVGQGCLSGLGRKDDPEEGGRLAINLNLVGRELNRRIGEVGHLHFAELGPGFITEGRLAVDRVDGGGGRLDGSLRSPAFSR